MTAAVSLEGGSRAFGSLEILKDVDLEAHLSDGWQFVSVLPPQRILIRA